MKQNDFIASLRRTEVVNVDEGNHPLPPDLGAFRELRVSEYNCPPEWNKDGVFVPVKEGDPMWFDFRGNEECAVVVSVQKVNPVTGEKSEIKLSKDPIQNYLWLPNQKWLDGYSNNGKVYQFIVTKSGIMQAVNEHILDKNDQDSWAIGFAFYPLRNPKPKIHETHRTHWYCSHYGYPKAVPAIWDGNIIYGTNSTSGIFKSALRSKNLSGEVKTSASVCGNYEPLCDDALCDTDSLDTCRGINLFSSEVNILEEAGADVEVTDSCKSLERCAKASMGMGGRITQKIISDPNTIEYYTEKPALVMNYYLCLPEMFDAIMSKGLKRVMTDDKYVDEGQIGGKSVPLTRSKKSIFRRK